MKVSEKLALDPPPLGMCSGDWCDRPAVLYVSGPTYGRSPRLLILAGDKASALAECEFGVLETRCLDCACAVVVAMASTP